MAELQQEGEFKKDPIIYSLAYKPQHTLEAHVVNRT